MRIIKRLLCMVFAILVLSGVVSGCKKAETQDYKTLVFTSFLDIPGVNDDEIRAIEALRARTDSFAYGMLQSDEAFEENGEVKGFSALFCRWLTELFDIPFNTTICEWDELLSDLEAGGIDFTGELTVTGERLQNYLMTDPISERMIEYAHIIGSIPLSEIVTSRMPRFAFLDGTATAAKVAGTAYYPFETVSAGSNEVAYELLKNGEADAFFSEGTMETFFNAYDDVAAEIFFPMIITPVSLSTQNRELWPVISVVQKALQNGAGRHLAALYKQGRAEYRKHTLSVKLSEEERAYIRNNPLIPFAAEHYNYPISFFNAHENQWQGILFDVLSEVTALTGMSFELVNDQHTQWPDLLKMLETGEASLISELIPSENRKGRFLWPKTAIMTDYYALLSRSDTPDIDLNEVMNVRVGIPSGTAYAEMFKTWFPKHTNTKEYESSDESFLALDRGEVDMVISSERRLLALTNYNELSGYKANLVFDRVSEAVFGVNKDEVLLCSILDTALRHIDVKSISGHWMHKTFDYKAKLIREERPYLIGASILLLCVLVLLSILFYRKSHEGIRLERLVQRRTTELKQLQSDLEDALESAQSASQSKSTFLANMSHEIRTPMNAIIGMTNIGKTSTDIQRKNYCLSRIEDASHHLLGVINDILDISKIEASKFELSPVEFNFEKMLQRVVNVVNFRVDEKRQSLKVYIDRTIPDILIGDDQRLAQVITNLVGNAVKFTPEGGMIRIGTYFLGEESGVCRIRVEVTDTGIGISPEQQSRLFTSFQQAESSTSRKFGGTGLGLTISKSIVEMMNGKIWIESELGKGSTFAFIIQLSRGAEKDPALYSRGVKWNTVRILAVDDDTDTLAFFVKTLQKLGAFCDTVISAEDALELVERNGSYDIYFVDWKLPGIDGVELTRRLKKREINPSDVAVIMFSAAEWSSIEDDAKQAGVEKFLSKPLFPSTIIDAISDCLGTDHGQMLETPPEPAVLFTGRRILLAEDVEINREIVQALLEPTQLEIDYAENGAIAVRKFSETPNKYDMIFMDVQMPEMDGYTATRNIRALNTPRARTIPIIAMTANVFKEDIEKCLEAGMNSHIGKPLNFDDVLVKLRTYLI